MGGGENPTYSLIFLKMFYSCVGSFFMHMWYYYVVKKLGCRYSVYIQETWNCGSN